MDYVSSTCLVKAYNIGETTITNICSGKIEHVNWGQLDWLSNGAWTFAIICGCAVIGGWAYDAFSGKNALKIEYIPSKPKTA